MWFYSVIFFLLLGILSAGYFFNFKKTSYWSCVAILFVISGFRPEDCCLDYTIYLEYYEVLSTLSYTFLEPSYFIIADISKILFNSPVAIFVIYSALGVTLKSYAFTNLTKYYAITLILYFGSFFLLHEMTQIRVGVAAAFLLLSIPHIVNKKPLYFFPLIAIGILFHYSLIIFIPFYFFNAQKINPLIYIGMIITAFLAFAIGLNLISVLYIVKLGFISDKIISYKSLLDEGVNTELNLLNPLLLLRIVILSGLLYKWKLLQSYNVNTVILLKIYSFSILFFILLADLPVLAGRVSQLLGVVEIILVPFIIYICSPKYLAIVVSLLFGLLIMYKQLYYSDLVMGYF